MKWSVNYWLSFKRSAANRVKVEVQAHVTAFDLCATWCYALVDEFSAMWNIVTSHVEEPLYEISLLD